MHRPIALAVVVFLLSGCYSIRHLDELLFLNKLSEEQKGLDDIVEFQIGQFKMIKEEYESNQLERYNNQKKIKDKFGAPVLIQEAKRNDQMLQLWIYRHPTEFFDTDKLSLYFDKNGELVLKEFDAKKTE